MSAELEIRQLDGLHDIRPADWDRLAGGGNPFLRHAFLHGLEEHDCLDAHGWQPCHLAAWSGSRLVGALPLYLRSNSYGEFVFDWAWADAYQRAGGRYYPKLVSAIPFTPVCGPRLLIDAEFPGAAAVREQLAAAALHFAERHALSSVHCLFPPADDEPTFERNGFLRRKTCQFHWFNRGYRDFQDFLDALTSKRRKAIRRERRAVGEAGVNIERLDGRDVTDPHWRRFYEFYCSTFHRRWGSPRLTLPFFMSLSRRMPEQTLLILASRRGRCIAGAFAMLGDDAIYGRHWGCEEDLPFLHFELCYYQTIDLCIERRLSRVDAGVQGEHKLSRGFAPIAASSFHWLRHPGFRAAIEDYLKQETREVDAYMESLEFHLPYRSGEVQ
ncbi:MAG: N-acetyltransferase [Gammaproteobacteria bacterium]|nr:N-acetyltransferase [Gammaproteobacteria bacterium]